MKAFFCYFVFISIKFIVINLNVINGVALEINGILNETLSVSGQLLVKLFGKEEYEYNRYKDVNHKMISLNLH